MLSSGFPMTANPTAVLAERSKFGTGVMAQEPGDSRITALVELVNIIYSAIHASGASSGRQLDLYQIGRLNMEMDVWATEWVSRLQGSESQANRLPFTSWRWYRLALNTAPLGSLLSPTRNNQSAPNHRQLPLLQSLDISVRTASHILLALSTHRSDVLSLRGSSSGAALPIGPFDIDKHATTQLLYSVDSTWVTLTFSVAFLVLADLRGTIDGKFMCLICIHSSEG